MSQIPNAISVVIPTYNRAHLIKQSLLSVLDQTLKPYEIIVVDDFSTDNTEEVIKSLNSPLIKYVKNQRKKGANGARNTGILMADGEYIAFHDSDDVWLPEKLAEQLGMMHHYPDVDLCFCSIISDNEKVPKEQIHDNFYEKLKKSNLISTQTIMVKKTIIVDYLFDEQLKRFQDWDVVLRLAENKISIKHLNKVLVIQNIDGDRISNQTKIKMLENFSIFFKKHPMVANASNLNKLINSKIKFYFESDCFMKKIKYITLIFYYRLLVVLKSGEK